MEKAPEFYSMEKGILDLKKKMDALKESDDPAQQEKLDKLQQQIEEAWAKIMPKLTTVHIAI